MKQTHPALNTHAHTLSGGVLVVLNESSQAKVGDLTHQVISHQDVGSSQVPVDVVHPLDEGHAVCDLGTRLNRTDQTEKSNQDAANTSKRSRVHLFLLHVTQILIKRWKHKGEKKKKKKIISTCDDTNNWINLWHIHPAPPHTGCQLPQRCLRVSGRLSPILKHFSTRLSEERGGGVEVGGARECGEVN